MEETVILLRSEEDAAPYHDFICERGGLSLAEPMLTVRSVPFTFPEKKREELTGIILTSAHAVEAIRNNTIRNDSLVFAVGDATAMAARLAGFEDVRSASGTVDDLVSLIERDFSPKNPLLYARGGVVSRDLSGLLRKKGYSVQEIVVYDAVLTENLSENFKKLAKNRKIGAVCVFSARSGRRFETLVREAGFEEVFFDIPVLCLSPSVLDSLDGLSFRRVLIAPTPDREGMFSLLKELSRLFSKAGAATVK